MMMGDSYRAVAILLPFGFCFILSSLGLFFIFTRFLPVGWQETSGCPKGLGERPFFGTLFQKKTKIN